MEQSQFLKVLSRDEAERRFHAALDLSPLPAEEVGLELALGRVLAVDIPSGLDVPGFTRSNVDGFAVRAADTFGAAEETPRALTVNAERVATGMAPKQAVQAGTATVLATGGVLPRGADAVVMVEQTSLVDGDRRVEIRKPVAPGAHLSQAGLDIARGETVLRAGVRLTSHEITILASLGLAEVPVVRRPRVVVASTGDELRPPGTPLPPGCLHDSNSFMVAHAVTELGGEPLRQTALPDQEAAVEAALRRWRDESVDMIILSGGTSKGAGDVNATVVHRLAGAGVAAHGVALKPGKPICLAVWDGLPVVILPGFPTSAIFTFHEFVAPVLRAWAGLPPARRESRRARLPVRINSDPGRTEYLLVALVQGDTGPVAVPLGRGSGSVTAFGAADGFITVPRSTEYLEPGTGVEVTLLGRGREPADLVVMGSHCLGLDPILGEIRRQGFTVRFLANGSQAGLDAVGQGHAHLAGIHLLDAASGSYNRPFMKAGLDLIPGYSRMQGVVFAAGDSRFTGAAAAVAAAAAADPERVLINRNRGSGTRVLLDGLLGDLRPPGYRDEALSHHAVAAAVAQGRADWGVAIEAVARLNGLGFLPLQEERFDFVVRSDSRSRPAVAALEAALSQPGVVRALAAAGCRRN